MKKYNLVPDEEIVKAYKKFKRASIVARELNIDHSNVLKRLQKLGVTIKGTGPVGARKYSTTGMIKMYKICKGNYSEMGRKLGTTHSGIWQVMKKLGLYISYPAKGKK